MSINPEPGRLDADRVEQAYRDGFWKDERPTDLLARHARERPEAIAAIDAVLIGDTPVLLAPADADDPRLWLRALDDGFTEVADVGSLRILCAP